MMSSESGKEEEGRIHLWFILHGATNMVLLQQDQVANTRDLKHCARCSRAVSARQQSEQVQDSSQSKCKAAVRASQECVKNRSKGRLSSRFLSARLARSCCAPTGHVQRADTAN